MMEESRPHAFLEKRISKREEKMQTLQDLKPKDLTTKTMFYPSLLWGLSYYIRACIKMLSTNLITIRKIVNSYADKAEPFLLFSNLPEMQQTGIWSLSWEYPLEEEMATHSNILTWRIPQTEDPVRLKSTGSQRVRHDWVTDRIE